MSDPIRIQTHSATTAQRTAHYILITPEIQAQILAPLEKRIAALEHHCHKLPGYPNVYTGDPVPCEAHDGLSLTEPHFTQDNGGCVAPIGDKQNGDEAAVEAHNVIKGIIGEVTEDELNHKTEHLIAEAIFAAIRECKVPGVYTCKTDAEMGRYHVAYCEQMKQERDAARAEVERLRRLLLDIRKSTHDGPWADRIDAALEGKP